MDLDFEIVQKAWAFWTGLQPADQFKLAVTTAGSALASALFVYKRGKASAQDVVKLQDTEMSLLRTKNADQQSELARIKPTNERLGDRVNEQTQEILALRAALSAGSDGPGKEMIEQLQQRVDKFDRLKNALLGAEDEVWKLRETVQPPDYEQRMMASRVKVLTIGNLKGGVGKTTLTANLAAYLALARKKRVLVIDFDYQGSLTRMMLSGTQLLGGGILADTLLGGEVKPVWLTQAPRDLGAKVANVRLITCGPTFDGFENRALLRWLMGEIDEDVRFRLADLLLSDIVQKEFDVVLIDAPPRLSLGTVNALCASHGLIIPTVPDALSVDATSRFVTRANSFRTLNPILRNIGIVTSMSAETKLKDFEMAAMQDARQALAKWNGSPGRVFDRNIRRFSSLAKAAGKSVGYLEDRAVRTVFDELGEEIASTWQL